MNGAHALAVRIEGDLGDAREEAFHLLAVEPRLCRGDHQRTFRGVAHHAVDRFTGRARRRLHLQARIACKHSRLQEEAHRGVIPQLGATRVLLYFAAGLPAFTGDGEDRPVSPQAGCGHLVLGIIPRAFES